MGGWSSQCSGSGTEEFGLVTKAIGHWEWFQAEVGWEGPSGVWMIQARGPVGGAGLGGGMDWLWVGAAWLGIDLELSRGGTSQNDSGQGSGSRRTACRLGPKGENKAKGKDGLRKKV